MRPAHSFTLPFRKLQHILLIVIMILVVVFTFQQPTPASAASFKYPYNTGTSITFNISDVTTAWNNWKSTNVTSTNAGSAPRVRVMGGTDTSSSTSEGQGYGILMSSIFDDQSTLDGLWLFTSGFLDSNGLMNWHVGNPGQVLGAGAASDGDEDMALGLLNACVKVNHAAWPASSNGLNYCTLATTLINNIYNHERGTNNELLPGDQWSVPSGGIENLSYFSPGYYTPFGKFTNNTTGWNNVISRNYSIAQSAQGQSGNCSKLVPNWVNFSGVATNPGFDSHYTNWYYDAARFGWRISVDKVWYNSTNAVNSTNSVGSFFANVGISNVKDEFTMGGTNAGLYHNPFSISNDGTPIWAATTLSKVTCGAAGGTVLSTPQQAYTELLNNVDNTYYNGAWRVFGMLLMTGNFPNLYELGAGSATATTGPSLTPSKTNTPAPTATKTNTPAVPTNTPAGPTKTPTKTNTPGPTNTPVPPTKTNTPAGPTNTPGSSTLKIQYADGGSSTSENSIRPHFKIVNTGTTAVAMSTLKVRYYFTKEPTTGNWQSSVDFAAVGSANIVTPFTFVQVSGSNYYVEYSFTTGAGSIAAGGNSGEVQTRWNLDTFATFDKTNDYSYSSTQTTYADWSKMTLWQNSTLVWGTAPY